MEFSDLNRRGFLQQSATAAAVGAGLSATSLQAAVLSKAEVEEWTSRVGARFRVGQAELQLQRVNATDHTTDAARPKHLRTHSVAMLFVLKSGTLDEREQQNFQHGGHQLLLSRVVPPRKLTGQFYEAILN